MVVLSGHGASMQCVRNSNQGPIFSLRRSSLPNSITLILLVLRMKLSYLFVISNDSPKIESIPKELAKETSSCRRAQQIPTAARINQFAN